MKINVVIRKYRKEANLTQEQLANYLGVTAPAVNKWENGISYPDITLLTPLARVLKIDVDTLLSFKEELTNMEIEQLLSEISHMVEKEGFEKAFEKGESLVKEYSNCDSLISLTAQLLNMFLKARDVKDPERYEKKILQWYELAATSSKQEIASMAISSLVGNCIEKKEYERAQQLLDKIPASGYDKQPMQAKLYYSQNKNEEAYAIYENMILKNANEICSTVQLILSLLVKEKEYVEGERYADIGRKAAALFDLGAYNENMPELFLAMAKREKVKSLDALEQMVMGIDTFSDYQKSDLYSHMKFKELSNLDVVKNMIGRGLESDKELDFLREEPRFKTILKSLNIQNN